MIYSNGPAQPDRRKRRDNHGTQQNDPGHRPGVHALNEKGFYVTVLSTSGGFLRQKNTTLMICTDESRVEEALAILKRVAGKRTQTVYQSPCTYSEHGMVSTAAMVPPVATAQDVGGVTAIVMDVQKMDKF